MKQNSVALPALKAAQDKWLGQLVSRLETIKHGRLNLTLPHGQTLQLGEGETQATVILKNYTPLSRFMMDGDLALAESYMDGDWECPDLTALFDLALKNEKTFGIGNRGGWLYRLINRLHHKRNANSKSGSKRNISYHYDLGNDFYKKWLDETMTYSSALFEKNEPLEFAQLNKYRTIAKMADIQAEDHVLEIGCGWGGFSQVCAQEYNASIHGVTLSKEQLAYAKDRYKKHKLDHLATASLTDYRDINQQFDKIISIEMFEAVGYENWDTYFQTIKKSLKKQGSAVLQIILIDDERFDGYQKSVDFIQKYIFPGGLLPSQKELKKAIERNALKLDETLLFGESYAKTCEIWQKNFQHSWDQLKPMGFDQRFKRMWEYYLSYCEAGFKSKTIDVGLFKITHDTP